ncbi:hypothetical protein [Prosthecobacter sp.]|uniref:hypothetical protein n=1 Tax=Prosthecobacter sp. TaxID=1965333 RepID=UPI0037841D63
MKPQSRSIMQAMFAGTTAAALLSSCADARSGPRSESFALRELSVINPRSYFDTLGPLDRQMALIRRDRVCR